MAQRVNKGYLIPENPEPVEDACMVVFYPDDPIYRRALIGAITTFGSWVVWERDAEKRAAIAANRWKKSIIRTLNQKFDCEILPELEDDGTMAINITTNCGCCGGGGVSGDIIINVSPNGGGTFTIPPDAPTQYNPNTDEPPDIGGGLLNPEGDIPPTIVNAGHDSWGSYDVYMCDFASFLPTLLAQLLRGLETFSDKAATLAGVMSTVVYLFPEFFVLKEGAVALWELVQAIIDIVLGEDIADNLTEVAAALETEPLRSDITCAVFNNRYDLPTAHSEMLNNITQWMVSQAYGGALIALIDRLILKVYPLKWFFYEATHEIFAPMPAGADCSGCGGSAPPTGTNVTFTFPDGLEGWEHAPYQYPGWVIGGGSGYLAFSEGQWGNVRVWCDWNGAIASKILPVVAVAAKITRIDLNVGKNYTDDGSFLRMIVDNYGVFDGPHVLDIAQGQIPYLGANTVSFTGLSFNVPVDSLNPVVWLNAVDILSSANSIFVDWITIYLDITEA